MSTETQYTDEVGETAAPKPSAVRRSGKINYARRNRMGRPGFNPPAIQRMTAIQQAQAKVVTPEKSPEVEPEVNPAKDPEGETAQVEDKAVESPVFEKAQEDTEEKKLDTPDPPVEEPAPDPPLNILDDEMFSYTEDSEAPAASEGIQEKNDGDKPEEAAGAAPVAEETSSTAPVDAKETRPRVYRRPHTNQTVVLGGKNADDDGSRSTATGVSQPRQSKREEEEDEEELSQTSVGNSKRRARMARQKKRRNRRSRGSPGAANLNSMGNVVSQAFDSFLGYSGGKSRADDDSYATEGSENIMNDWQEAILSTLGCSVPQHGNMRGFDDDTTVNSATTGRSVNTATTDGQSRQSKSSLPHNRTKSDLSGSVFSTVSSSHVGSVLSFDTTDELADFSKKQKDTNSSFKVPDSYDRNPPKIPQGKTGGEGALYSEDLYSGALEPDFEPVDLLSEGDSMMESVGKDILDVANTKVNEVLTTVQGYLGAGPMNPPTEGTTVNTSASSALMSTLSNITEPLGVITENDAEASPMRVKSMKSNDSGSKGFEDKFENNVFKAKSDTEVVKADSSPAETEALADQVITDSESDASLFQGIDDEATQPKDLLPEVEKSEAQDEKKDGIDFNTLVEVSEKNAPEIEEDLTLNPTTSSIEIQGTTTNTTATSTEKASTDSINVDRKGENLPAVSEKESKVEASPDATSASIPPAETTKAAASPSKSPNRKKKAQKAEKTSFQAAIKAPEPKKPKKGLFKGLFKRSKKNKKGKNNTPLASTDETVPAQQAQAETIVPEELKVAPEAPSAQVEKSAGSPEPEPVPEETPADAEEAETREQVDPPAKDVASVGEETKSSAPISCPTTPVREPEGAMSTPKMSNLGLEDRKLTRPVSGTNLADLPGISENRSFREDPPAPVVRTAQDPPTFSDGHVAGFEKLQNTSTDINTTRSTVSAKSFDDDSKDISFDTFNFDLDLSNDQGWESFGDNADVGQKAFKLHAIKQSPQKVSAFPY